MYREETLLNVIRSVTRNGRSIILTAVLALILVYLFSIIGYMFFKDDFLVQVDDDIVFGEYALCIDIITKVHKTEDNMKIKYKITFILHFEHRIFRIC